MFNLDFKSLIFSSLITIAVGGGLYSAYLKLFGETAITQTKTYAWIGECYTLQNSYDIKSVEKFLLKIKDNQEKINKSDVVTTIVGSVISSNQDLSVPKGMGVSLNACVKQLESKLEIWLEE
jgi:hypothetical protein